MIVNTNGATRRVFLTKNYAFKIPYLGSWRSILHGLLANLQERRFGTIGYSKSIAPVLFSDPLGFLVVMPRCAQPILYDHWQTLQLGGTVDGITTHSDQENPGYEEFTIEDAEDNIIPGELKEDGFGYLNGRLVVLDYGS